MTKNKEMSEAAIASAAAAALEAYEKAVVAFAEALQQLHGGQFAAALATFETIESTLKDEPSVTERARMYAAVCRSRLAPERLDPTTADDCYNDAVVLSNRGEHDEALRLLNRALQEKTAAKFLYARASVHALKRNSEAAIGDLRQAIAAEPQIRFQAVNDSDFESIREEPAFIDIIEPTPAGA